MVFRPFENEELSQVNCIFRFFLLSVTLLLLGVDFRHSINLLQGFWAPFCCGYDYYITFFNEDWTHILRRFKSCSQRVRGLRWWKLPAVVPPGNKASHYFVGEPFHETNYRYHYHYHHHWAIVNFFIRRNKLIFFSIALDDGLKFSTVKKFTILSLFQSFFNPFSLNKFLLPFFWPIREIDIFFTIFCQWSETISLFVIYNK